MKGVTSGIVKEGDLLVIEGGIAKHIINPKKRSDKIAGAYATAYNDNMLPVTVYVDVKDIPEDNLPNIEAIARARAGKMATGKLPDKQPSKKQEKQQEQKQELTPNDNITKTAAKILKVDTPQIEGESQRIVIATVQGPKGKYNVLARDKYAERLIALEGETAHLHMTKLYNQKYKAYEAAEVHFTAKKMQVETSVVTRGGEFFVLGKNSKEVQVIAHDLETIGQLEKAAGKRAKVTLEGFKDQFVVTDVELITDKAEQEEKAS